MREQPTSKNGEPVLPSKIWQYLYFSMPLPLGITGVLIYTHVCPALVSSQYLKFTVSKSFEIYTHDHEP
jgi:hypothetical protein